ncbi:MAG: hypothetical protein AMK73_06615 [Planctomycetes bacterium SM23_32]|nr:MAG: hypothetical protein AMK73_06615 [Planctomycetes bacterium SM23_32]
MHVAATAAAAHARTEPMSARNAMAASSARRSAALVLLAGPPGLSAVVGTIALQASDARER